MAGNISVEVRSGGGSAIARQATPSPYVARAVHFAGASTLRCAAPLGGDSRYLTLSAWVKHWVVDPGPSFYRANMALFQAREDISFGTTVFLQTVDNGNDGGFEFQLIDWVVAPPHVNGQEVLFSAPGTVSPGVWHHYLIAIDTGVNPATVLCYVGDVPVTLNLSYNFGASFLMDIFRPGLTMPDYVPELWGIVPPVQDMADVWMARRFVDISDVANRRKFISAAGKPVYLGADGLTPLGGVAPAIFFRGPAEEFVVNRGDCGAFDLVGPLVDAATSPSD